MVTEKRGGSKRDRELVLGAAGSVAAEYDGLGTESDLDGIADAQVGVWEVQLGGARVDRNCRPVLGA